MDIVYLKRKTTILKGWKHTKDAAAERIVL